MVKVFFQPDEKCNSAVNVDFQKAKDGHDKPIYD